MNQRLTPAEIVREVGMNRNALDSYLRQASIREVLGGSGEPPTFPRASLPMFERLRDLHAVRTTTPLALASTLERLKIDKTSSPSPSAGIMSEDRLLTEEEAALYVACAPAEVSRYVRPIPHRYSLNDIQAYIRSLRDRAGEA